MPLLPRRSRYGGHAPTLPFAVLAVGAGGFAGAATAHSTRLGVLVLLAAVLTVLAVWRPVAVAVVALIGVFLVQRLGGTSVTPGSSGGISYSDALLTAAAFLAIPALVGKPELRRLRLPIWGLAAYLSCLLPTVFLNASHRAYLEWAHRLVLVGGASIVGAWIVRERIMQPALRWLLATSAFVALATVEHCLAHGLAPGGPFALNKNFVGGLLASVLVVVVIARREFGISPRVQFVSVLVVAGGIVAAQSRGGMLAAVVGVLVALMLDPRGHNRRARALSALVAVALAGIAYASISHQLHQTQQDRTNGSLGVRFNVEKETRRIWRTSPTYGVGLKYFNTGNYGQFAFASNNAVDNELAESGVIGLVGFVLMQGTFVAAGVQRRRDRFVTAGIGVVVGQLMHGMVDIYWSAGTASLPFILFGIALARAPARSALGEPDDQGPKMMRSARAKTASHL